MVAPNEPTTADDASGPPVLVMTRVFDAPRGLVYRAWTEPARLVQWCAPRGFTIPHGEGDVRPGGAWRSCMRTPDGRDLWLGGVYREVVAGERLVFTHVWDGADGRPGHETLVTVTFADHGDGGRTLMSFRQENFKSAASRDDHRGGWDESFGRLGDYLNDLQSREAKHG